MMAWISGHLTAWLVAALPIGALTMVAGQYVKRASNWVDSLPSMVKRTVVIPAIAAVITALGAALGVPIVCAPDTNCLTALDQHTLDAIIKAALGVAVAFVAHAGRTGNSRNGA
jgi:hypothetical protein